MQNKWKNFAIVSIIVNGLGAGSFLFFFIFGSVSKDNDGRQLVHLTQNERHFVLSEMRGLLEAMNTIHKELSLNNREAAAMASEKVGLQMVRDNAASEGTLMLKLPAPMKKIGIGTHEKFDETAKIIRSGASPEKIHQSLAILTSQCVACHTTYRLY